MPMIKRSIEPAELSRTKIDQRIHNELECVTNNTLANVIRQLSSLSKHADDMFSELVRDASGIFSRTMSLTERVNKLNVKVTQLDSTVEEVSLTDINMRKPFKSSVIKEQQVVSIKTRPQSIQETYARCDAPPTLDKLNPYREDGKDSMKFYTDPTYFFELWCHDMQNQTENQKRELKRRKQKHYHTHHEQNHVSSPPGSNSSSKSKAGSPPSSAAENSPKPKQTRVPQQIREAKSRKDQYDKLAKGKEFAPEMHRSPTNQSYSSTDPSISRPNSLEITAQQQYAMAHKAETYHPNGPITSHGGRNGGPGVHFQGPPAYSQQQAPPEYSQGDPQQTYPQGSPYKSSPSRTASMISSMGARPSQPPPAPPSQHYSRLPDSDSSHSASRESLPPPPPPPPANSTPPRDSPHKQLLQQRDTPSPQLSSHASSMELPPPPPPPMPHGPITTGPTAPTPDTPGSMPPPPPTPPPVNDVAAPPPPPPPPLPGAPPPPPPAPGSSSGQVANGRAGGMLDPHQLEAASSSLRAVEKQPTPEPDEDEDGRSDLLEAIRKGIQLKKVERQEKKKEQQRNQSGRLDVQSIMEAAFEMRRRALEEGDSEEEGEDDEMDWSDGEG